MNNLRVEFIVLCLLTHQRRYSPGHSGWMYFCLFTLRHRRNISALKTFQENTIQKPKTGFRGPDIFSLILQPAFVKKWLKHC